MDFSALEAALATKPTDAAVNAARLARSFSSDPEVVAWAAEQHRSRNTSAASDVIPTLRVVEEVPPDAANVRPPTEREESMELEPPPEPQDSDWCNVLGKLPPDYIKALWQKAKQTGATVSLVTATKSKVGGVVKSYRKEGQARRLVVHSNGSDIDVPFECVSFAEPPESESEPAPVPPVPTATVFKSQTQMYLQQREHIYTEALTRLVKGEQFTVELRCGGHDAPLTFHSFDEVISGKATRVNCYTPTGIAIYISPTQVGTGTWNLNDAEQNARKQAADAADARAKAAAKEAAKAAAEAAAPAAAAPAAATKASPKPSSKAKGKRKKAEDDDPNDPDWKPADDQEEADLRARDGEEGDVDDSAPAARGRGATPTDLMATHLAEESRRNGLTSQQEADVQFAGKRLAAIDAAPTFVGKLGALLAHVTQPGEPPCVWDGTHSYVLHWVNDLLKAADQQLDERDAEVAALKAQLAAAAPAAAASSSSAPAPEPKPRAPRVFQKTVAAAAAEAVQHREVLAPAVETLEEYKSQLLANVNSAASESEAYAEAKGADKRRLKEIIGDLTGLALRDMGNGPFHLDKDEWDALFAYAQAAPLRMPDEPHGRYIKGKRQAYINERVRQARLSGAYSPVAAAVDEAPAKRRRTAVKKEKPRVVATDDVVSL